MNIPLSFGSLLRELRQDSGWLSCDLTRRLDITQEELFDVEYDDMNTLSFNEIDFTCGVLGLSTAERQDLLEAAGWEVDY